MQSTNFDYTKIYLDICSFWRKTAKYEIAKKRLIRYFLGLLFLVLYFLFLLFIFFLFLLFSLANDFFFKYKQIQLEKQLTLSRNLKYGIYSNLYMIVYYFSVYFFSICFFFGGWQFERLT